jgi:DNA-binding NarL/FixJ family response regulator
VRVQIEDASVRSKVVGCLTQAGTTILAADVGGDRRRGSRGVLVCDAAYLTRGPARAGLGRCVAIVPGQSGDEARRAFAAGATGVVFSHDLAVLAATVTAVAGGQLVVPSSLRTAVAKPVLTTREKQIMALVVLGFTNREIADQLFLAESTIKSHLFSAFRRLGVRTRKEATALILDDQQGLGTGILSITR